MSSDSQHENPRPDPSQMTEEQYADYMADPHAFHPEHHGAGEHGHDGGDHHVTSKFVLRAVLGILVFFTILTVASSRAEIWVADVFELEIPTLVNVFIAMSIATIKAIFVVAIFMHLKWDNRLNLLVFLFTLMGVGLFVGLTALDLGNRTEIYDWKASQIHPGGKGDLGVTLSRGEDETIGGVSVFQFAKDKKIQEIGEKAFQKKAAEKHGHHGYDKPMRSADRTRATHGLTVGLFSLEAEEDSGHGEYDKDADHAEGDALSDGEEQ
ncbi:MAG: cytochrome C oxidase subunit IV family protein [Phycisphaerales bacterium]|jgi:cytochrome c oxidase subunit 4